MEQEKTHSMIDLTMTSYVSMIQTLLAYIKKTLAKG
jgi:hypothetical protein